jgi:hypothetical protein
MYGNAVDSVHISRKGMSGVNKLGRIPQVEINGLKFGHPRVNKKILYITINVKVREILSWVIPFRYSLLDLSVEAPFNAPRSADVHNENTEQQHTRSSAKKKAHYCKLTSTILVCLGDTCGKRVLD